MPGRGATPGRPGMPPRRGQRLAAGILRRDGSRGDDRGLARRYRPQLRDRIGRRHRTAGGHRAERRAGGDPRAGGAGDGARRRARSDARGRRGGANGSDAAVRPPGPGRQPQPGARRQAGLPRRSATGAATGLGAERAWRGTGCRTGSAAGGAAGGGATATAGASAALQPAGPLRAARAGPQQRGAAGAAGLGAALAAPFELSAEQIGDLRLDDAQLTFRLQTQTPEERHEVLRRHVELLSELENPYLTGCHSVLYVTRPRRKRLRPTPSIVHVRVLRFIVRDRERPETGKAFVLDNCPRALRADKYAPRPGPRRGSVGRPSRRSAGRSAAARLLAPRPAAHASPCRYGRHSVSNRSRLNSSSRRSSSSSIVSAVSASSVSATASSASSTYSPPGTLSRSAR